MFFFPSVSIHTSRRHGNCCQQVTHSIKHLISRMQSETRFYFLIARIDLMRLNVLKGNKHSNKNSFWRLLGFFFSFLLSLTGAAQCFNSQEKQLKAGRGLTYTQWSKIDERHPAWTNHSTQGEASQQTWKVQEAMANGLENAADEWWEEKVVAPFTLYPLCPLLLTLHPAAQSPQSNVLHFCKSRICHVYWRWPSCQEVEGISGRRMP